MHSKEIEIKIKTLSLKNNMEPKNELFQCEICQASYQTKQGLKNTNWQCMMEKNHSNVKCVILASPENLVGKGIYY